MKSQNGKQDLDSLVPNIQQDFKASTSPAQWKGPSVSLNQVHTERKKIQKREKEEVKERQALQLSAKIQAHGLTSDLNALATVEDPTRTITLLTLDRAGVDSGT